MSESDYKLLVVDDNEMNRDMLSRRLQRIGYQVGLAVDGDDALSKLDSEPFDLVLLDIMMPGKDGYQVLEIMKQHSHWSRIPVIMLTAVLDKSQVIRCLKLGADNYVAKPFDMEALKTRIQTALAKTNGKGASNMGLEGNTTGQGKQSQAENTTFDDLLLRLKNGNLEFPALPDVAFKMIALLEREDVSLNEIGTFIKVDPAITTMVIKVANSAFYRGVTPIVQVEDALARIGLSRIAQSLMPIITAGMFNAESPQFQKLITRTWQHSLSSAMYAKLIGKATQYPNPEMLFTLGMFHDIGELFLLEVLQELSNDRNIEDETQVLKLLDQLHTIFGETLIRRWELPQIFVDVVGRHHKNNFEIDQQREVQIIVLADTIALQQQAIAEGGGELSIPEAQLAMVGLNPESLDRLMAEASVEIDAAETGI